MKTVGCESPTFFLKKKKENFPTWHEKKPAEKLPLFTKSDWTITRAANELEAENTLYKIERLSLTIICSRIPIYKTT